MKVRDQTAHSVQSDLDLHSPQKLLVSSAVRKELILVFSSRGQRAYVMARGPSFR